MEMKLIGIKDGQRDALLVGWFISPNSFVQQNWPIKYVIISLL